MEDCSERRECKSDIEEDLLDLPEEESEDRKPSPRPLIVYRHPKAQYADEAAIRRTDQFIRQFAAALEFSIGVDTPLKPAVIIRRTNAHYRPGCDPHLRSIIRAARRDFEALVMDDVLRLVDCHDPDRATKSFNKLLGLGAPIFSVNHGYLIHKIPAPVISAHLATRVLSTQIRSSKIKRGLARSAEFRDPPGRKVIESAAEATRRKADARAAELMSEIERIRAAIPEHRQSNLKAIADGLNAAGVATPSRNGSWQGNMVKRVLDRMERKLVD